MFRCSSRRTGRFFCSVIRLGPSDSLFDEAVPTAENGGAVLLKVLDGRMSAKKQIKERDIATTFRYPCYRDLLRSLGNFDAICGYTTIAVEFLNEAMEQNPQPREWLARYSKGHGVTLHDVDNESLASRLAEMCVMLVHSHFEEFLRDFLQVHAGCASWGSRGDAGLFEYVTKHLGLQHRGNAAAERETIEYYRLARNVLAHPDIKTTRLDNQRAKLRKLLRVTDDSLPPKPLGCFDYGDSFMFTRAVKAYAAIICQEARPSDAEIAALVMPEIKPLNRFRNKPKRFRNGVGQFLRMNYNLHTDEADRVIDVLIGR
jgi:hypothetical protein